MLARRLFAPSLALPFALALAAPLSAQGYVCAEGGGNEQNGSWSPSVFGWMVEKGGFGDVIVLGVAGSDAQMANEFLQQGAASATNLAINAATADLQSTYDAIVAADIVYLRGGNQANYVQWWNGTLTEQAIQDVYAAGGVIGGTSAGCAVMGEVIYDSITGSLTERQALENGQHPSLSLTTGFLELTPGVMFDSHFTERGRLPRTAVMLGFAWETLGLDILAAGVDDRTALCVSPDLTAEVRGEGAVTFLHRTAGSTKVIQAGEPPVLTDLRHVQLTEGYVFDLVSRQVVSRPPNATLAPPPGATPSWNARSLSGSANADSAAGELTVLYPAGTGSLFEGAMQTAAGDGDLLGAVVRTLTWGNASWDEARTGGVQWALTSLLHGLGVLLDNGTSVRATTGEHLLVEAPVSPNERSVVLLDSHGVVSTAASTYVSTGGAAGPRQSVALEDVRLHLITEGMAYDLDEHRVLGPETAWSDLGGGLAGAGGAPTLAGSGVLVAQASFDVTLSGALPGAQAWLVLGLGELSAPFKGGTLVPTPDVIAGPLPVDGSGQLSIPAAWPADVPSGAVLYSQMWVADGSGPAGYTASNGLSATAP